MATLTVVTGIVTAVAAFLSALAAWKAVSHAKSASQSAEMAEKRILVREIVKGCRETISITARVQDLATQALGLIKDLAIFAGQFGGSRQKVFEQEIEKDKDKMAEVVKTINALFSSEVELHNFDIEHLNTLYAKMSVHLAEATAVREKLEAKIVSLNNEIKPFRERAINAQP